MAVPKIFCAEKTGKEFENCSLCGNKFDVQSIYIVEKAFKKNRQSGKHELIFEYALCNKCQENMRQELSEESLKSIGMYYKLYVDFEKRYNKLIEKNPPDNLNDWISHCIITGKPISEQEEYTIGAQIYNNELIFSGLPFALGAKALEEMQELLSKKTKDFLDGFQKEIFPPDIREKIPDGSLVIM